MTENLDWIAIAQRGFEAWKAKPHNARWFRKIDGTPIPNDLTICIGQAFADELARRSPPPAVEGGSGEQHEAWLNIYKRNGEYIVKALDPTPERAEVRSWMGIDDRIACVRIEFTDPTPPALEKTGEKP